MGDVGDYFNDIRAHRKEQRDKHGIECPGCKVKRPKAFPTILLPQQRCKVCGHRDPRPRLDEEE